MEGELRKMEEILSHLAQDATSGKQKAIREACTAATGEIFAQIAVLG